MNDNVRNDLIRGLSQEFSKMILPDEHAETYLFDESTGTYYCLTGKTQMALPEVQAAEQYFRKVFAGLYNKEDYEKRLYVSIAIEAINKMIASGKTVIKESELDQIES